MRKTLLLLIFATFNVAVSLCEETGFSFIRNYPPKEYNSYPQVFSVLQDHQGLMYFGCNDILEYDGVTWRAIPIQNNGYVRNMVLDKNGRIYIAAESEFGYISITSNGVNVFHSLKPLLNDSTFKLGAVKRVIVKGHFIYFLTYDAILRYDPDSEMLTVIKDEANDKFSGLFVFNDECYVRLEKKGLMKVVDNQLISALNSEFFRNTNNFNIALPFNSSTFLIPTKQNGLLLYHPDKKSLPEVFTLSKPDFFKDNQLYTGVNFESDRFILGSTKQGAVLLDNKGNILQQYNENKLLQNNTVYSIASDLSHNIWLGLDNGIAKSGTGLDWCFWNKQNGLGGTVTSVIRFKERLYVTTLTKAYYFSEDNRIIEIKGIPAGSCWCFLDWNNGQSLLLGTSQGIYEIKGEYALPVCRGSHVVKIVRSLTNPNRIFASSYPYLISLKYENGRWHNEGIWDGINDDIRGIVEDENGTIWIGTFNNGVIKLTPVVKTDETEVSKDLKVYSTSFGLKYTIRLYTQKEGIATLRDLLPFWIKDKIVWGSKNGLYVYHQQKDCFEPFSELGKTFCDGKHDILLLQEMPDGAIWICPRENKEDDIFLLQPSANGYSQLYAPFRQLPEMEINALYIEPSGVAWFGGSEGLFRYDKSKDVKEYDHKYNCLIRKVTITGDSILYGGSSTLLNEPEIKIDYQYNSIKFEFAAPFFDNEEKTLYSYQLLGNDTTWSSFSRQTNKEYTHLWEGTYTFNVRAKNIYNVESRIGTYTFVILPPLYRTWWAYVIYFLAFAGLVYVIVRIYTRRLVSQKAQLERIVEDRTAEVVKQRDEIYNQKEEIQEQAEELKTINEKLVELSTFKEGMTGMIVHDLKNPLHSILSSNNPTRIQQAGKQMLNMVLNILDVQKFEDAKLQLDIQPCSAFKVAQNAFVEVAGLLTEKNISFTNNIPLSMIIKADGEIIERVFVNLLTNATKYTPINGSISIAVVSNLENTNGFARFEVSDNGQGISADKIHLVFEKFGQIEAKKSGGIRSTGLGLTFCKLAIEAHGGQIGVESVSAVGTTFWFLLPTDSQPEEVDQNRIEKPQNKIDIPSFSLADIAYLVPYCIELQQYEVFEFSKIMEIFATINSTGQSSIESWKIELENAIRSCNQTQYNHLISNILSHGSSK